MFKLISAARSQTRLEHHLNDRRMNKISEKRILVTGGFGFIGSHLVEQLMQDFDSRIHVVDNMSTSPINVEKYTARVPHRDRLTWDICAVKEYFQRTNLPAYDEVFHLANVVGPVGVLKHAGEIVRRTVDDTYAVSDFVAATRGRLCDVSTSEVYGGGATATAQRKTR